MIQNYLVNQTNTTIVMRAGYLDILPYSYAAISLEEGQSFSVKNMVDLGLVRLTSEIPSAAPSAASIVMDSQVAYKGMTLDELRVEQAKDTPSVAAVSAIGSDEPSPSTVTVSSFDSEVAPVTLDVVDGAVSADAVKTKKAKA